MEKEPYGNRCTKGKEYIGYRRNHCEGVRIFGGEKEFRNWLDSANYALGDAKPVEMLKDPYGVEQVDSALESISWGNYI